MSLQKLNGNCIDTGHSDSNPSKVGILDLLIKVAPLFGELFPIDCSIAITDREYFLANFNYEKLGVSRAVGERIPENTGIKKAITTGTVQKTEIPKEVYGQPIKSIALPVRENGEIVGCLALAMSLKNQRTLEEIVQVLATTVEEITASTEELAAMAGELAKNMEEIDKMREELLKQVEESEKFLDVIRDIAAQSQILGINAAIEAARAGQTGRGFGVIATEIRKMAETSKKSVEEVKALTLNMRERISEINEDIKVTFEFSRNQAAASQEISKAIQGLIDYIEKLEEISKLL
ncbi:methyl-accepting chemotaxis protein [Thermovorax subterraneus]|nr:methyl-accepting chemotaxis protein [Thermovorax subterraneus]